MKTVIWMGDQHVPDHDVKTNATVLKYVKDFKPNVVILGGDILDMTCLGAISRGQLKQVEGRRVKKELEAGKRYLDQVQEAAPKSEIIYLQGNHEYRVDRWLTVAPHMEGLLDIPEFLELEKRKIKWIPSWAKTEPYRIGKALFIHGLYHGKYHTRSMVENFGTNVFYGHMHDCDCVSKITLGDNSTKIAQSLGCLCNYRAHYLKGRPTNWQQAFGQFHFRDDGYFNHYVVRIHNHAFVAPSGELYK